MLKRCDALLHAATLTNAALDVALAAGHETTAFIARENPVFYGALTGHTFLLYARHTLPLAYHMLAVMGRRAAKRRLIRTRRPGMSL